MIPDEEEALNFFYDFNHVIEHGPWEFNQRNLEVLENFGLVTLYYEWPLTGVVAILTEEAKALIALFPPRFPT